MQRQKLQSDTNHMVTSQQRIFRFISFVYITWAKQVCLFMTVYWHPIWAVTVRHHSKPYFTRRERQSKYLIISIYRQKAWKFLAIFFFLHQNKVIWALRQMWKCQKVHLASRCQLCYKRLHINNHISLSEATSSCLTCAARPGRSFLWLQEHVYT